MGGNDDLKQVTIQAYVQRTTRSHGYFLSCAGLAVAPAQASPNPSSPQPSPSPPLVLLPPPGANPVHAVPEATSPVLRANLLKVEAAQGVLNPGLGGDSTATAAPLPSGSGPRPYTDRRAVNPGPILFPTDGKQYGYCWHGLSTQDAYYMQFRPFQMKTYHTVYGSGAEHR